MEDHLVAEVEILLGYQFRDRGLLVEALTHSSHPDALSYQRLEFVGDAALGLLFTNHLFLAYPDLQSGELSLLRSANVCNEKLARVAVRHNLYHYLRRNTPALDDMVRDFTHAIKDESDEVSYGCSAKAPKVLADIVEAVAAAVYLDCGFDLKVLWGVFRDFLEPMVTKENFQLQPATSLFELCQKEGKQVDIKYWKMDSKNVASVYVEGKLIGSGSSERKDVAKLNAVKESLQVLLNFGKMEIDSVNPGGIEEKEGTKQMLNELCKKNGWSKPSYRVDKEVGPEHDKKFFCSVRIKITTGVVVSEGDPKSRVKEAENSAAFKMLAGLLCNGNVDRTRKKPLVGS